jgi:protein AbiQ
MAKLKSGVSHFFFAKTQRTMNFYIIDDAYIAHLKLVDSRVPENYKASKPFIGVVLQINDFKYFAPLTSHKPKQDGIRHDSPTVVKLHERGNEGNKLGMIQLNNMIPVPDQAIKPLDMAAQPSHYARMLNKQHEYIKTVRTQINEKAQKLYKLVCVDKHHLFARISCDFQALEQALGKYGRPPSESIISPPQARDTA